MGTINLYKGVTIYHKGFWNRDTSNQSFVDLDPDSSEYWEYEFDGIIAKSVEQLSFILSKTIQEEKNLKHPVFIDWREIKANIVGQVPDSSKRFDELVPEFK